MSANTLNLLLVALEALATSAHARAVASNDIVFYHIYDVCKDMRAHIISEEERNE